jgi:hypothetical protein
LSRVTLGGAQATAWSTTELGNSTSAAYTASVILPYDVANSGSISLYYTVPVGSTVDVGGSFATATTSGIAYDATTLIGNKGAGNSNTICFIVNNATTPTYYQLNVTVGLAKQYYATVVGGSAAGTVYTNLLPMSSLKATAGTAVLLAGKAKNAAGTSNFKEWRFSTAVKVSGVSVTKTSDINAVFVMPAYDVDITAYYENGLTYSGTGGTKYYLTIYGETSLYGYDTDGSYAEGESITIYPATTTGFDKWIVEQGSTDVNITYSGDTATFTMPARNVTLRADNYDYYGNGTLILRNGAASYSSSTPSAGSSVYLYYNGTNGTFTRWYTNRTDLIDVYDETQYFTMPSYGNVVISANINDIDYYDEYGDNYINVSTSGVGTASADKTYANDGELVKLTAYPGYTSATTSSGSTYNYYNDPYYLLFGNGGLGYNYGYTTTYTYSFSNWSISGSNYNYYSTYTSTSNPTYITVYSDIYATAYFKTTAINPVTPVVPTPVTPSRPSNANTYTNGDATATINTSTGTVTAGVNSTGTLNSTATANAVKSVVSRGLSDANVTVTLPSSTTAISKSAMQKLITAAGNLDLRIQIQSTYGTILLPMSSARQVMTKINGSSAAITNAIAKFKKAYGNTDIVGIQTTQNTSFGVSATYRISADAIGLSADYGDKVYIAIYDPAKGTFSKKTVTVNAKGEIAFASSASGVILFSSYPFAK